jgi:hypothetical protein
MRFPPPRHLLPTALKITAAVLLPLIVVYQLVGGRAVLPGVLALLSVAFVPYCTMRQAIGMCAALVAVGTLGTAAYGNDLAVVALVVATCLAAGFLSRFSAGVFGVGPIVAAVAGLDTPKNPPLTVAVVMTVVCAYVILVVYLTKVHVSPTPVPLEVATRHAVVMAVACGAATAVALYFEMPKSYWLVMTLAIVLRPYAVDSLVKNRRRVLGTVAGAMIAALLSPLPRPWQMVMAAICMTLMFAYMAQKDYVLQVTFMTPMVIFLVSSGSVGETFYLDGLRVLYTVAACVVGGLVSLALARGPDATSTAPA